MKSYCSVGFIGISGLISVIIFVYSLSETTRKRCPLELFPRSKETAVSFEIRLSRSYFQLMYVGFSPSSSIFVRIGWSSILSITSVFGFICDKVVN